MKRRPGVREWDHVEVGDRVVFNCGFERSGLVVSCDPVGTERPWCEDPNDDCGRSFSLIDVHGRGMYRGSQHAPAERRTQTINECQIVSVEVAPALVGMLF